MKQTHLLRAFLVGSLSALVATHRTQAGNTWDAGGGASTNWTTATNWDFDTTATSGSGNDVAFGAGTASLNDYGGYVAWRSILFNSGLSNFTLNSASGANWDLYFKIENNSANAATINIDNISLKSTINGNEFDPTAGNLTINTQNIYNNGSLLSIYGTKILTISNTGGSGITGTGGLTLQSTFTGTTILSGSNNYTGATNINGGKLQINSGGSLASGSAVTVTATGAGALTVNSGGSVGGNVSVGLSSAVGVSNLVNSGTIGGTLTINAGSAPIAVQGNTVISGNATLNGGSSTGNILNNGQLTISGSTAVTTGTISSTGTGNGASAGKGAIFYNNTLSTGNTLNLANGSSFSWLSIGTGAVGALNTTGTVSLYGYGQGATSTTATPFTININSGIWNVGQVGQNNSGKVTSGTTNISGGSTFNLAAIAANGWSGIAGASNGGSFMHGIWNIGGASSGTMNITGGFSESGGSGVLPTTGATNGLQFTVGNGGTLTTTTASTLGFTAAQAAGLPSLATTNSLTVNAGGAVTTAGNFNVDNTTNAQGTAATTNSVTVNGGTFSNSGGILYIGNQALANTFLETNSVTVAGGILNQAGGAVSLGASGVAATNYANSLTVSSGAMNIGTSASTQALQLGTAQNTAASVSNTVNLTGGKLVVSGQISALAGTGQVNTFNWTAGQLTAGTVTATSATWAAAGGGGIASSILNNTGGTFAPGDIGTGGKTTVTGGYTQGASGVLAIDIGSNTIATAFQSGVAFYDTIAMTGSLTLGGRLNVSAINSYTPSGTFNIITGATSNSGTFTNVNATTGRLNLVNANGTLATGSMVFTRGATSTLTAYAAGHDLIWLGDGATNAWNTSTSNWNAGVGTNTTFADGDFVTFDNTGSQSPSVALNSTLSPTAVIFANTSGTYTLAGSGKISGASTVTVQGAGGTVALNTANDYSGATSVTAGTFKLGNATALGNTTGSTSVTAGAVLDLNGQTVGAEALTLNGTGISSGGALINSGSAASLSGLVTFSTGTSIGGSGSFTLSGGIASTAATNNLIKTGAGTVTLSAAATTNRSAATATTQIDNGVLRISNASALATGTTAITTINSGGTLQVTGGITLDQPITFNNGGTLSSDGTNTSQGKATVSAAANASVTLSTVSSGDVFTVGNGSNDITGGSGTSVIHIAGPGSVLLSNSSDYTGNWSADAGTLLLQSSTADLGATSTASLTLAGGNVRAQFTQGGGNRTFVAGAGNNVTVSANSTITSDVTTSTTGITYTFGSLAIGAQTLTAAGGSNVNGGTAGVTFGSTTLSGNATFNVTAPTGGATLLTLGTLSMAGNNLTTSGTGNVVGGSTTLGGAVSASIGASAPLTLGAITDGGNQLTLTGAGNFAQSAAWASGTAGGLTLGVSGGTTYSGAATLNQANTFTGGVTLNSGTLNINLAGTAGASGPLGNGGTLTINGGTLDNTSGSSKTLANVTPITVNANFAFTGGTGTTHDLNLGTGATTLGTAAGTSRTITANAGILTLGGIVANGTTANKIVKAGGGTLGLTSVNTFTGGVDVNNGALLVGGTATNTGITVTGSATGTGNVTFASNTTLSNSSGATWFVPQINLAGAGSTLNLTGGNRLNVSYATLDLGDTSRTGVTTVNANSKSLAVTGGNTLTTESTGNWSWETGTTLGTPVIQNGTLDIETTTFSGSNYGTFFMRSTTFSNADLTVGANVILAGNGSSAFGTNTITSPKVTINTGGIINMLGTSKSVKSLSGGGSIFNSMVATNTNNSTLTINGTTGSSDFSGVISNGPGTGALSLTKTGGSTQILSGTNTYTGATLISGGTLALGAGGSIDNTSGVSLGTVGTFDVSAKALGYAVGSLTGSGNVTGSLSVSTQLAIGNSPGTINFSGNLSLGSASTFLYDMTGGTSPGLGSADLGDIAGNLTISTSTILDLVELGTYTVGNKFTLFAYDGTLTGNFSGLTNNSTFVDDLANPWLIRYDDSTAGSNGGVGNSYVTITAVPEPNVAMLVGGLGVLALLRRRRI